MQNEVKNLGNISVEDAKKTTSDIEVFGNGDAWLLISKASSKSQGWMKSTKAMQIDNIGVLVQTSTEHRSTFNNIDGNITLGNVVSCSEALQFIRSSKLEYKDEQWNIVPMTTVASANANSEQTIKSIVKKEKVKEDNIYIGKEDKTTKTFKPKA